MAERRVAQVVAKRDGFGKVFVEAERAGDGARDLRDFKRVREPRAEMVALGGKEHLRFVRQAAEAFRVQDLIAVALVFRAQEVGRADCARPSVSSENAASGDRNTCSRCCWSSR